MVLEIYSVQNSPRRYFGSPMPSDSNALNSYKFKVTYITNIIVVYCLNAYDCSFPLKGTATLMISMFYQKELYEP